MDYRLEWKIEHEGTQTYVVNCRPLTQERAEQMQAQIENAEKIQKETVDGGGVYTGKTESDIVADFAFSSITLNGEPIGWKQLPIELFAEACEQHPSFRAGRSVDTE